MRKLNYIKLPHQKRAQNVESTNISGVQKVVIPTSQHIGCNCDIIVKVGDEVKVGQVIADSDAEISAPVHASISGTVREIVDYMPITGELCKAVVIESNGKDNDAIDDTVKPPFTGDLSKISRDDLIKAMRDSGAVGLGGAGFPTHAKFTFDKDKCSIETLLINGAECEPYICSDYREMMENGEDIIGGIKVLLDVLGIPKAVIGIESNKPDAIKHLREIANDGRIEVRTLKTAYPLGAEKMLIHAITGKVINEDEYPIDKNVIVLNVSTIGTVYRYLKTGMPLITRRLTIDGDCIDKPLNLIVPIGTLISDIFEHSCDKDIDPKAVLAGGPMMGLSFANMDSPIVKNNNAILLFKESNPPHTTSCIRCGDCIRACPVNLMPVELERAHDMNDIDALIGLRVNICINCGNCSYVCPAKRRLAEKHQISKHMVKSAKKKMRTVK